MSNDPNTVEQFVSACRIQNQVWGIHCEDGWVTCPSSLYEDMNVIPFWTNAAAAEANRIDAWKNYDLQMVPLDEFIDIWLIEFANDHHVLVGPNWESELFGEEIQPIEMEAEFLKQMFMPKDR